MVSGFPTQGIATSLLVKFGESLGEAVEGPAKGYHIVFSRQIKGQHRGGRQSFHVSGEDFASATTSFSVLDGMEETFEEVIGALHHAEATAHLRG